MSVMVGEGTRLDVCQDEEMTMRLISLFLLKKIIFLKFLEFFKIIF